MHFNHPKEGPEIIWQIRLSYPSAFAAATCSIQRKLFLSRSCDIFWKYFYTFELDNHYEWQHDDMEF